MLPAFIKSLRKQSRLSKENEAKKVVHVARVENLKPALVSGITPIPGDIIEEILDRLDPFVDWADDSRRDMVPVELRSLCLVSRAWFTYTRSRLYRVVPFIYNSSTAQRLLNTVESTPAVLPFIRRFYLASYFNGPNTLIPLAKSLTRCHCFTELHPNRDPPLPSLHQLNFVSALDLDCGPVDGWGWQVAHWETALQSWARVEYLCLSGGAHNLSLIARRGDYLPQLRTLKLRYIYRESYNMLPTSPNTLHTLILVYFEMYEDTELPLLLRHHSLSLRRISFNHMKGEATSTAPLALLWCTSLLPHIEDICVRQQRPALSPDFSYIPRSVISVFLESHQPESSVDACHRLMQSQMDNRGALRSFTLILRAGLYLRQITKLRDIVRLSKELGLDFRYAYQERSGLVSGGAAWSFPSWVSPNEHLWIDQL